MTPYKNRGGYSNIQAFEIGVDYIVVKFYNTQRLYTYSYQSAGRARVEDMKRLAIQGQGLNSYIMKNAKQNFEK